MEWADEDGSRASRTAARTADIVVLTCSALLTLQAFDLLDAVAGSRSLIAPRSLREQLRAELDEAEERVTNGEHNSRQGENEVLSFASAMLVIPYFSVNAMRYELLEWVDATVSVVPRPLEAFGDARTPDNELRVQLGESASDALELALFAPGRPIRGRSRPA